MKALFKPKKKKVFVTSLITLYLACSFFQSKHRPDEKKRHNMRVETCTTNCKLYPETSSQLILCYLSVHS